jgi:hypothetical protein
MHKKGEAPEQSNSNEIGLLGIRDSAFFQVKLHQNIHLRAYLQIGKDGTFLSLQSLKDVVSSGDAE